MAKINVESVKYDMSKTKKRKRANFIVDEKSEAAVIERLEKIHKGEVFEMFHELVWGEVVKEDSKLVAVYTGFIKFYDSVKGFGFIKADIEMEDLFFHASALISKDIQDGDAVEFELGNGPKGVVAVHVKTVS